MAYTITNIGNYKIVTPEPLPGTGGQALNDNARQTATDVASLNTSVAANTTAIATKVPTSRTITTTAPLTIGGGSSADLSANRTLAINAASSLAAGSMSAADKATLDAATSNATANTLVKRDGGGGFNASSVHSGVGSFLNLTADTQMNVTAVGLLFLRGSGYTFDTSSGQSVTTTNNTLDDGSGGMTCSYINFGSSIEGPDFYVDDQLVLNGWQITTDGTTIFLNGTAYGAGGGGGTGIVYGTNGVTSITFDDAPSSEIISGSWGMNFSGDATHPFQFLNCSFLVGIKAAGANYGSGNMLVNGQVGIGQTSLPSGSVKLQVTGGAIVGTMASPSYATTISIDPKTANVFKITTSSAGNATINLSNTGVAAQEITFIIANDSGGARTITFGTNFKPSATLVGTASKTATIVFVGDGTNYWEVCRTLLLA